MTAISATMVKQLRDRTGQAMMDCKKALTETDGDMEKAVDLLRKKGMAVMEKRGGRETKEGRVISKIREDGKRAVLAMLCSETDFTSKNDDFLQASELMADAILNASVNPDSVEAVMNLDAGDGKTVGSVVNEIISKTGEKVTVGDFACFELTGSGKLYSYVHFNGKVGTLLQIETADDAVAASDAVQTLVSDLAMHITAINPESVTREDVDPEAVARERDVAVSQVKDKPANIVDKIVDGKMNKWYQQIVLLEQPFVKDDKKTVTQLLDEVGKEAGGEITVKCFRRLQIG
ncbi:MAG: translation elongation factor Ts [Sedimentisphaerales bacterium]|nr:translation elongation factor Ts [Sedimentisphaerales bacterium]